MMKHTFSIKSQSGLATLMFSLVILFTLTLTTIFGARVALLDEKMATNNIRATESMAAAETGMDQIVQTLSDNYLLLCTDTSAGCKLTDTYSMNGTITNFGADYSGIERKWTATADVIQINPNIIIDVVATGTVQKTVSGVTVTDSTAQLKQKMVKTTTLGPKPDSALTLTSSLTLNGTLDLVNNTEGTFCTANKDLHGNTVPCSGIVSIWSPITVDASGDFVTCTAGSFYTEDTVDPVFNIASGMPVCDQSHPLCKCLNGISGKKTKLDPSLSEIRVYPPADPNLATDIVAPPVTTVTPGVNFPSDLFEYVFGIPKASYLTIYNDSKTTKINSCDQLNSSSRGTYWIIGDCKIVNFVGEVAMEGTPASATMHPIRLVVQDGQLSMQGSQQVFGLGYVFNTTGNTASIKLTGGEWYGAIIDDSGTDPTAGNFALIYDKNVFDAFDKDPAFASVQPVPGTWRDW